MFDKFWKTGEYLVLPEPAAWAYLEDLSREAWRNIPRLTQILRRVESIRLSHFLEHTEMGSEIQRDLRIFTRAVSASEIHAPETWQHLDISHLRPDDRMSACLNIYASGQKLTQEAFNFLTCRDVGTPSMLLDTEEFRRTQTMMETGVDEYLYSPDLPRLALAFKKQMVEDATSGKAPVTGYFEMQPVPMPILDSTVSYHTLRLFITGRGIWMSMMQDAAYGFAWWSPESHTLEVLFGGSLTWVLDALLSCIWRDSRVVGKKAFVERQRQPRHASSKPKPKHRNPVVLPRVVNAVSWSSDAEREYIIRRTHAVGGFYRPLPAGHKASEEAFIKADKYGYEPPPEGHTFVKPHTRGEGAAPEEPPRKIICRGLQVARIALSIL